MSPAAQLERRCEALAELALIAGELSQRQQYWEHGKRVAPPEFSHEPGYKDTRMTARRPYPVERERAPTVGGDDGQSQLPERVKQLFADGGRLALSSCGTVFWHCVCLPGRRLGPPLLVVGPIRSAVITHIGTVGAARAENRVTSDVLLVAGPATMQDSAVRTRKNGLQSPSCAYGHLRPPNT